MWTSQVTVVTCTLDNPCILKARVDIINGGTIKKTNVLSLKAINAFS